jgi:hypothetical protein
VVGQLFDVPSDDDRRSTIEAPRVESTMQKLVKVLKAIGRFVNGAIKDMLADTRAGGGMSTRQERDDIPPD